VVEKVLGLKPVPVVTKSDCRDKGDEKKPDLNAQQSNVRNESDRKDVGPVSGTNDDSNKMNEEMSVLVAGKINDRDRSDYEVSGSATDKTINPDKSDEEDEGAFELLRVHISHPSQAPFLQPMPGAQPLCCEQHCRRLPRYQLQNPRWV
jgi:hypothetical protein